MIKFTLYKEKTIEFGEEEIKEIKYEYEPEDVIITLGKKESANKMMFALSEFPLLDVEF